MRCKTTRNKGTGRLALRSTLKKLKIKCTKRQKTCIFHLILLGVPSSLVLPIKNKRWFTTGRGLLNGQNLLKCGESYLIILKGKDC